MTNSEVTVRYRAIPMLLASVLAVVGLVSCSNIPSPPTFLASRPECPHAWIWPADSTQHHTGLHSALLGNVGLVQDIINVPEFHDCQRFITRSGADLEYAAFFAIWASSRLATLTNDLTDVTAGRVDSIGLLAPGDTGALVGPEAAPPPGESMFAVAAAEIYAEGRYEPLGIQPWLNCLYLFRRNQQWEARMVPMGSVNVSCPRSPQSALPAGQDLRVIATAVQGFRAESDYPPVARWDWDATNEVQYIGIKCGAAWCEIGARTFVPSAPLPAGPSDPRGLRRVRLIKGWYDQQSLAFDNAGKIVPSGLKGTIIPDTMLGRLDNAGDFARFIHVADVVLEPGSAADAPALAKYKARFNFVASSVDAPNRMFLCSGGGCTPAANEAPAACGANPWVARVAAAASAGPGPSVQRCVKRRSATDYFVASPGAVTTPVILVPGTVRWRWVRDDEGTWARCMQGCCEMELF